LNENSKLTNSLMQESSLLHNFTKFFSITSQTLRNTYKWACRRWIDCVEAVNESNWETLAREKPGLLSIDSINSLSLFFTYHLLTATW
jgi:hypothetical protein